MSLLRSHWGFSLLLALAAPLIVAFCWHDGISSMGDDSVSYLVLARHFARDAGPLLAPWVPLHSHFAPLFPLALALFGAGSDLLLAHMLVAACAIAALVATYGFALAATGRRAAALALVAVLLLAPTSWSGIKGILSEPMYLLASMLALRVFAERLEQAPGALEDWVIFGALLSAAYLTRTAGIALVAAFAAHAAVRVAASPRARRHLLLLVPLAMVAAPAAAWIALRPAAQDGYAHTAGALLQAWIAQPGLLLAAGPRFLLDGWIASFAVDAAGPLGPRVAIAAVGLAGLAGAALRVRANRLDGWYVLATLAMLTLWVFDEGNMRRLLYPVVPLLLLHAAFAVHAACVALGRAALAPRAIAVPAALLALLCAPGAWLTLQKARDTQPLLEDTRYGAADITDYYLSVDGARSRAVAAKHAAVITGFELLARVTPPGSRVMWARPEYVALLGDREGVPLEYGWDARALAAAVRRSNADFIAATALAKTDLAHAKGDPLAVRALASGYVDVAMTVPNAVAGGEEFVLLRVDRARLARALER